MMFESFILAALRHLLGQHPWARERLVKHAGRSALLSLPPLFRLGFVIAADGSLEPWDADEDEEAEVQLILPVAELPSLLAEGPAAAMSKVRIEGNADFAEAIGFVFRHLRWNAEEDLSRLIGDLGAHRLGLGLRALRYSASESIQRSSENLAEYFVEEAQLLTPKPLLGQQNLRLIDVRDRLGRLQQRVERLETRLRPQRPSLS